MGVGVVTDGDIEAVEIAERALSVASSGKTELPLHIPSTSARSKMMRLSLQLPAQENISSASVRS